MPEIQMPKLSDTMTEGTLIAWKKKKGDQVAAGEVLAEIETDKATMEWESPEDGTLTEIYVQEGGKVNVGDKIAFVRGQGEEAPKQEAPEQKKKSEAAEEKKPQAETEKPAPAEAAKKETAPPQQQGVGAAVSAARAETTQQKPSGERTKTGRTPRESVACCAPNRSGTWRGSFHCERYGARWSHYRNRRSRCGENCDLGRWRRRNQTSSESADRR